MAVPKIKFCWNGSRFEADWHLGLFGTYARGSTGGRRRGLVISGRGLLGWLSGLGFVMYFGGALALWAWLERRPYNLVTYPDLILPTRWSGIQKLRGQALIAEGKDDIKARRWGAGLAKLRTGIARNPEELEGRLLLAEIFTAMKARRQAVETYDGGLATRYPGRSYVEAMIKSAAQSDDHDWWLRTCDRALALVANNPALTADRNWLVEQKLAALVAADRSDEALALAESAGESGGASVREYRVLALLNAGKPAKALEFLQAWGERVGPRPDAQVIRLRVRAFRESGDMTGMDHALEQLRSLSPAEPRPYVYAVVQHLLAGRRTEAVADFDGFLFRFGGTPRHLNLLAAPLAEIHERQLLEQLIGHARQQGFDLTPLRAYLVQALIGKGDWTSAAGVMDEIEAAPTKDDSGFSFWKTVTRAQIQAALDPGEGAQSRLVDLVRGRQLTIGFYKDLIAALRSAGRPATAREIITFAQGVYPQSIHIEAARKELELELAAAQAAKPVLVSTRPQVAAAVSQLPAPSRVELTEADFMKRVADLEKTGDYEGALKYVREARFSKPGWLDNRDADLARYEMRFSGRTGDRLALRSAVRLYNTGDRLRSAHLVEIARELHDARRDPEALLVLKELLAKTPDLVVAQRLLADWSPPSAPVTP